MIVCDCCTARGWTGFRVVAFGLLCAACWWHAQARGRARG